MRVGVQVRAVVAGRGKREARCPASRRSVCHRDPVHAGRTVPAAHSTTRQVRQMPRPHRAGNVRQQLIIELLSDCVVIAGVSWRQGRIDGVQYRSRDLAQKVHAAKCSLGGSLSALEPPPVAGGKPSASCTVSCASRGTPCASSGDIGWSSIGPAFASLPALWRKRFATISGAMGYC